MLEAQLQVEQFMKKAGQDCPPSPIIPDIETIRLRMKLIREETDELLTLGFGDPDSELSEPTAPNIVEVADAIADLLVVTIGCAVACGIYIEPIFNEVMRSNMSKFIDGHRRTDGKWIKGPSYSPANLQPLIDAQKKVSTPDSTSHCTPSSKNTSSES